jgi:hypothetical protein
MLEAYDVSWLLIHGTYRPGLDGRLQMLRGKGWKSISLGKRAVPYGYLEGLLFDLAALGVRVKQVRDLAEAAFWLGVLHRWWSKPWHKHKGLRTFDQSRNISLMPGVDPETLLRARVAAQLPGVGFERALSVARHFPSIVDMINADASEWEQVPGIGKVIARAVWRATK